MNEKTLQGWLSFSDLCDYCGFKKSAMAELVKQSDFPKPSIPTGCNRGKRWSRVEVDAWMMAYKQAA